MVTILERKGLVTRAPDAHNRHIKRITLTSAGHTVLSDCDDRIDVLEARMLDALAPADVEGLRKSLAACVQSLAG